MIPDMLVFCRTFAAKVRKMKRYVCAAVLVFGLFSCTQPPKPADNGAFAPAADEAAEEYDLDRILDGGELVVATLSGPDTYFDYHGTPMGRQYALAENFAAAHGLRLHVETARDTAELRRLLAGTHADIIALPLPLTYIRRHRLRAAGVRSDSLHTAWAVRADAEELARALDEWYGEGVTLSAQERRRSGGPQARTVRRKVHAPYISREKGIISTYDSHFRQAAAVTGWDWRLIAAQCYQESGFDPNAVSWAGAQGLMQIMPATADHLGLPPSRIRTPADNIAAAARFIRELTAHFGDIRDRSERQKFVLAAYNGGAAHVRDAMSLARKHGKNPHRWQDVSFYVANLSRPEYYRDPVVRHGYMIGSETTGYVQAVMDRWRMYGGRPDMPGAAGAPGLAPAGRPARKNRFTQGTKIYRPDDPEFNQLEE